MVRVYGAGGERSPVSRACATDLERISTFSLSDESRSSNASIVLAAAFASQRAPRKDSSIGSSPRAAPDERDEDQEERVEERQRLQRVEDERGSERDGGKSSRAAQRDCSRDCHGSWERHDKPDQPGFESSRHPPESASESSPRQLAERAAASSAPQHAGISSKPLCDRDREDRRDD